MKGLMASEFMQIGMKEQPPEKIAAKKIVDAFIDRWKLYSEGDSDMNVIEVEESDFNGAFDFSNSRQILRAATLLRNIANKNEDYSIAIKQRGKRLFIGMREDIEPGYKDWKDKGWR